VAKDGKAPRVLLHGEPGTGKIMRLKEPKNSEDQIAEWHAMVIRHLPRDMSTEERQMFIGNPTLLKEALQNALAPRTPVPRMRFKHLAVGDSFAPVIPRGATFPQRRLAGSVFRKISATEAADTLSGETKKIESDQKIVIVVPE